MELTDEQQAMCKQISMVLYSELPNVSGDSLCTKSEILPDPTWTPSPEGPRGGKLNSTGQPTFVS
jgi:hypothetical protein